MRKLSILALKCTYLGQNRLENMKLILFIVLGIYNFGHSLVGMDTTTSDFRFARARGGGLEAANHQTNWIAQQRDLGE